MQPLLNTILFLEIKMVSVLGTDETLKVRGHQLLQMHKEAKRLSQEKWQNEDDQSTPGGSIKKKWVVSYDLLTPISPVSCFIVCGYLELLIEGMVFQLHLPRFWNLGNFVPPFCCISQKRCCWPFSGEVKNTHREME